MAASGVRTLLVRFQGDTKPLTKASDRAGKSVDGWRGKMAKFNRVAVKASLAVGAAALVAGKDAFTLSQQLRDLDSKSKAVFEGQLGSMKAWAEENKAAFGTSRDQVVGLAANMADLLKPMGFTAKQAAGMSQEMLGLSGALASWSGGTHDAAQVSEILTKAMLGERDQLKSLGISISEADVAARLASKGQEELTGKALEQAKAVATQELILEKSTDAQDAWANGGKAAAEAQNASKVTMQELRETLARSLTPAFEAGTKMVQGFAKWVEKNQGAAKILAGVLVGLAAAVLIVNGAMKVWRAATVVMTGVQWALNVAMAANPLALIIIAVVAVVAALVLLYTKSETARKIMDAAFRGIVAAGKWLWENIVLRYIAGIKQGFQRLVAGAKALWKGIQLYFGFWKGVLDRVVGWIVGAKDRAINQFNRIVGFVRGLPGKVRNALSGLGNAISAPFRAGFAAAKRFYNSNLGGKGFDIPSWVPFGVGGKSFRFPTFHRGGVVPGPAGREVPIMALGGERVLTRQQQQSELGGGAFEGALYLDSGQFLGMVRGQISRSNRNTRRRVLAGAGAAR